MAFAILSSTCLSIRLSGSLIMTSSVFTVLGGPTCKPKYWKLEGELSELKVNLAHIGYLRSCFRKQLWNTCYVQGLTYQSLSIIKNLPFSPFQSFFWEDEKWKWSFHSMEHVLSFPQPTLRTNESEYHHLNNWVISTAASMVLCWW